MDKVFRFLGYELSDSLDNLITYLNRKKIKYSKNRFFIQFNLECAICKDPLDVIAFYVSSDITSIVLHCCPLSFSRMKLILSELETNYEIKVDDKYGTYKEYAADSFLIKCKYPENVEITVEFSSLIATEEKRRHKLMKLRMIPFLTVGTILSAVFITLYFSFKELVWLHVITAIVGIAYAIPEYYFSFIKDSLMTRKSKKLIMIAVPLIVFFLTIVVLLLFTLLITAGDFSSFEWLSFLMVTLYMVPSFHIILLLIAASSYA